MPTELQIIRASDFVRLGAKGNFDMPASRAALSEVAAACRKRGIDRAMMDLRALHPGPKPVFSPTDLAKLVNTFREIGFTREQRLAILYTSDPHHRARMFAFIGTLRGWHVAAFGNFEEAMEWLSEDDKTAQNGAPGAEETVLVKVRRGADGAAQSKPKIRPKSAQQTRQST